MHEEYTYDVRRFKGLRSHHLFRCGLFSVVKEIYGDRLLKCSGDTEQVKREFIDQQGLSGETLLLIAMQRDDCKAVVWLLSKGADMYLKDYRGCTVRGWAAHNKNPALLALIDQHEIQINRPVRREWGRVFISARASLQSVAPTGNPQLLQHFFGVYPGLARLVGGLILRSYDHATAESCDEVSKDNDVLESTPLCC